jgi:hypothetical protein
MLHEMSQYDYSRFNNLPAIFAADKAMRKGDKLKVSTKFCGSRRE